MHHVFVSYSRRDQEWVDRLVADLSHRDVDFWLDRRDIPFSVPWLEEVQDAIEESDLFLFCESSDSLRSGPCQAEQSIAENCRKPRHTVRVGGDAGLAADAVLNASRRASDREWTRTELRVRSRDWDRGGRSGRALVGYRVQRHLRSGLDTATAGSQIAQAFLAASRRRTVRRRVLALTIWAVVSAAVVSGVLTQADLSVWNRENASQADAYTLSADGLALVRQDPYAGLRLASTLGDSEESAVHSLVIAAALAGPVPDDAFTLGTPGLRFASKPVTSQVRVLAKNGTLWARAADAVDVRTAQQLPAQAGLPASEPDVPGAPEVRWTQGSAELSVFRGGVLWRRLVVDGPVSNVALSPDENRLAVAVGTAVDLVDLDRGTVRSQLRGAPAPLTDLAWTADGARVWGVAGSRAVSWPARVGTVLLDEPGQWFQALLPASQAGTAWLASRNGRLQQILLASGKVLRTLTVPDTVYTATSDGRGRLAVIMGTKDRMWLVDLTTGSLRSTTLPASCAETIPAVTSDDTVAYLPCGFAGAQALSLRTLSVQGVLTDPYSGVDSTTLVPGGRLILGEGNGSLVSYAPGTPLKTLVTIGCVPLIVTVAASDDGSHLLPVGWGTGQVGCTRVSTPSTKGPVWNAVLDNSPGSVLALSAAFDPTGNEFAIGYSDGTIALHSTAYLSPSEEVADVVGGIRGMYVDTPPDSGSNLYVVTRLGILQRIPLCPTCLTNPSLARAAADSLKRAIELGLTPASPAQE